MTLAETNEVPGPSLLCSQSSWSFPVKDIDFCIGNLLQQICA